VSALSERLKDAKGTRGLDVIVRLAEREGHQIDRSVVARYITGKHGRPRDETILALAAGLGLDVRELRVLAGIQAVERHVLAECPKALELHYQPPLVGHLLAPGVSCRLRHETSVQPDVHAVKHRCAGFLGEL